MARMTLEGKLAAVAAAEREPVEAGSTARWRGWLQDPSNVVVARVAEIIARQRLTVYVPLLVEAFYRLINAPQPVAVDKLCLAKEALVQALDALESPDAGPYLRGIRHVQMEPVYGGFTDAAANLRGQCAIALARLRHPDIYFELATLLFDPQLPPRTAAISALRYLVSEESELLLRMKVMAGDADPDILQECFTGLLALEPSRSLPFVAGFLQSDDRAMVEQAALALGSSRLEEAVPLLRARWEANTDLELRKSLLLALALTRSEVAFSYLLEVMREEGTTTALLACDALALYGVDRRYRERIAEAVAACRNPRLSDAFCAHFPPAP